MLIGSISLSSTTKICLQSIAICLAIELVNHRLGTGRSVLLLHQQCNELISQKLRKGSI